MLEERVAQLEKELAELREAAQPKTITFNLNGEFNCQDFLKKAQEFGLAVR